MSFIFEKINIDGVYIIHPHKFEDNRGLYEKNLEMQIFKKNGIDFNVTESSDLYTKKGAIRGLHYQTGKSQAKLVRVLKGRIFDVIVDLRKESKTFQDVFTLILDDKSNFSLYIPKGFAHGFLALEDSIFAYHCDGQYEPNNCGGLRWNDPKLDIKWPIEENGITKLIITDKDNNWPLL
jgi:dTDP-4-dehydrorhamnose 3,5-epimerase